MCSNRLPCAYNKNHNMRRPQIGCAEARTLVGVFHIESRRSLLSSCAVPSAINKNVKCEYVQTFNRLYIGANLVGTFFNPANTFLDDLLA